MAAARSSAGGFLSDYSVFRTMGCPRPAGRVGASRRKGRGQRLSGFSMAQNANSSNSPNRAGKRASKHDAAFQLQAIEPLLKLGRASEEHVAARAAEVGVSARSLRRWIAAHQGREGGGGTFRAQYPDAGFFIEFELCKEKNAREIHRALCSAW